MYAVFCYMTLDIVITIINDIIRLAYFEPRPFWDENSKVFPCVCEYTPSSPSPTATNSFLFFTLFLFVHNEVKLYNKLNNKNNFVEAKNYLDENESNISDIRTEKETKSNIALIILAIFLIALKLILLSLLTKKTKKSEKYFYN